MHRSKKIYHVSIVGIIANSLLVVFKGLVGLFANSIAIILDAINNLSDALSSLITIIAIKLASKKPDKEHPYGHGRIEYLSAMIIAILVFVAGFGSLKESISKIINPVETNYSIGTLLVIISAIVTKLMLGSYFKKKGEQYNSNSLVVSGIDALFDAAISVSTLICVLISMLWHIYIEGYIGVLISIFILKSAYNILKSTLNDVIGIRADAKLSSKLKEMVSSYDNVIDVVDIMLHNYGPNTIMGNLHIEVPEDMSAKEIHWLTRNITNDVYKELGIILTIGIYATNTDAKYNKIKEYMDKIIKSYPSIISIHGFYVDEDNKSISADIIFDFDEKNKEKIIKKIKTKLNKYYPKYQYNIIIDVDASD